jgi:branched-chain amino acid transport system ATP-binding protein
LWHMLKLVNVTKSFGALRAVDGVSFEVGEGTLTGLIGPNGSGKSTLFNVIAGVYKPDSGEVYFRGERIDGLPPDEVFQKGIVRSFQIPRLFKGMTVLSNTLIPPRDQIGEKVRYAPFQRTWKGQEINNARTAQSIMRTLQLNEVLTNLSTHISGGQMKLLEIGRASMGKPRMLLLDEPTAGVAPKLAHEIFEKIRSLARDFGITCFVIEHRLELLFDFVEKVFVMHRGRILAQGTKDEVVKNRTVVDVYLGD